MADSLTGVSFRYAGFWLRLVAVIVDSGMLFIAMLGIGAVFEVNVFAVTPTDIDREGIAILEGVMVLIGWLYYAGMESTPPQGTVGKLFMGIYVAGRDGDRVSFGRASLRYWAKIISSLILLIGYLMAAFTRHKQALHDIIAGCLVLKR
jgi:uncharacterized RDD family membrane protein YckC